MRKSVASLRWLMMLLVSCVLVSCEEDTIEPERFGSIEGEVIDTRNNQPLANVSLTTTPGTSSFTTGADGKFTIGNVKVGTYSLVARKTDYRSETVSVNVVEGAPTQVRIIMDVSTSSNLAPNAPFSPTPATQAVDQPTELQLKWRVSDPNGKADSVRSEVMLYESNSTASIPVTKNPRDTVATVTGLKYNTTYFWQVTARDKAGLTTRSDVWTFRTRALPDNQLLYVQTIGGNTDIYSSDASGANKVRLTSSPFVESTPRLSPRLDRIAYTSNATGQFQLYTMNRDGSDQRMVSPVGLPVEGYFNFGMGYCWSPDGARLLFASYDKLWVINRDGSGLAQLATAPAGRNFRECDWSGQNGRIVVQTIGSVFYDSEIYIMNENGSNMTMLIGGIEPVYSPSFNLQGTRIMYVKEVGVYRDATGRLTDAQIFTQNLDGSGVLNVSMPGGTGVANKPAGTNDILPRFTVNGAKIVFVNVSNVNQSTPEVWQVDIPGTNRMRLFANATQPDSK
ncbi:carboxypeptidase regulatory-like domain-containing protein [Hymenobacter psychrotolerans]|uniref:TolB protein n=1 Tax=Hymenobacter psychrotolerans DSM 18569 TaxID=1121959 RepID=A0A1M6XH36_9BACT|nr:carboxypeptidase regulatory-like domain-containing protein [Hymenobacter psychrotolerans]SHL05169.1 TolB protein [Hymenobacter psychrotolerans DSM 18569]